MEERSTKRVIGSANYTMNRARNDKPKPGWQPKKVPRGHTKALEIPSKRKE
jgi:hypothetical protein